MDFTFRRSPAKSFILKNQFSDKRLNEFEILYVPETMVGPNNGPPDFKEVFIPVVKLMFASLSPKVMTPYPEVLNSLSNTSPVPAPKLSTLRPPPI